MKRFLSFAATALSLVFFSGCQDLVETDDPTVDAGQQHQLFFTAERERFSPDSKTAVLDNGEVWWNTGEEISVFYGSGSNGGSKFVSQNTALEKTVDFSGTISMSGAAKDFWAVYPYSEENACDGNSITTTIPSLQQGVEGNFSDDTFPAMAQSITLSLAFWNICGGIKFSVSRSDIKSVTFKGNEGETLAGKVRVAFDAEGKPQIVEVLDGKAEVTLNAPNGDTFKAGKYYYITLLPASLDGGFSLTFMTASEKGELVSNNPQTIKRSIFGVLNNMDATVTEWKRTVFEPVVIESEVVDLGLTVKWASCNLGTTKPQGYGNYYAWGETETKSEYNWSTYKWCMGDYHTLTKYCGDSSLGYEGFTDDKTVLDPWDDAAHVLLGGNWRMPTDEEWTELLDKDNFDWIWTDDYAGTGVRGRIVMSKISGFEGNSIFLPAGGCRYNSDLSGRKNIGYYMSSALFPYGATQVWCVAFGSSRIYDIKNRDRSSGYSIRPVFDERVHPVSVSIDASTLSLTVGETAQLEAIILPEDAFDKTVSWSSDNIGVACVNAYGQVHALNDGTATIKVVTKDRGFSATCSVVVTRTTSAANYHSYVEMGDGLKWATCNVGAARAEESGDHFAWGETAPKPPFRDAGVLNYWWDTYLWCDEYDNALTKYNTQPQYGSVVDNKTVLELEDDAAHVNWGDNWRMPTKEEWGALVNRKSFDWTWTDDFAGLGVKGWIVSSKLSGYEGQSIFLRATSGYDAYPLHGGSYGCYWSSSLYYIDPMPSYAYFLDFDSDEIFINSLNRCYGYSVRPVSE